MTADIKPCPLMSDTQLADKVGVPRVLAEHLSAELGGCICCGRPVDFVSVSMEGHKEGCPLKGYFVE